jgi:hypothetical protein
MSMIAIERGLDTIARDRAISAAMPTPRKDSPIEVERYKRILLLPPAQPLPEGTQLIPAPINRKARRQLAKALDPRS